MPARAESQHEPSAAYLVDGLGHLGQQRRAPEPNARNERADLHPCGTGRQCREQRPALPRAMRFLAFGFEYQVIGHKEGVEAQILATLSHHLEVAPAEGAVPHAAGHCRDEIAELESAGHRSHPARISSSARPNRSTAATVHGSSTTWTCPTPARPSASTASAMTSTSPWISVARGSTGPSSSG